LLQELPGLQVINFYGPTENTTFTSYYPMSNESDVGPTVSIGRPVANTQVYILDAQMEPVGVGVAGELYIGGEGLARGYLNDVALTAEKFVPSHFSERPGQRLYRTGDRARYLPDGNIEFLGRLDHQIKIRGFRVELGEIETTLRSHPGVLDAVVLAVKDKLDDKRLVAYLIARDETSLTRSELRSFLRERLPEHMTPAVLLMLKEFPLKLNGKIDRNALPAPDRFRPVLETPYVAPRTTTEKELAGIFEEVLDVTPVGIHDSLSDLGGHSLKVTRIAARIPYAFQIDLPLQTIFESSTIAQLAQRIDSAERRTQSSPLPPIRVMERPDELPLAYSQERIWFLQQLVPESRAYHFQATFRFKGRLDIPALEKSLNEMVKRHEIIRTTFPEIAGRPRQVIHPPQQIPLPVVNLEAWPPSRKEEELQQLIQEEILKPFDLARLPLMRWMLYRLDEHEHLLVHVEHHLLHDGWSFNVFLLELFKLYLAYTRGEAYPLRELPIQYADFTLWQRNWIEAGGADDQLTYWKEKLTDKPGLLALPFDYKRPSVQSFRGKVLRVDLPAELCDLVKAFSHREAVSLFMTMFTAFLMMLHRYTGEEDLWVGCGIANRRWPETEGLIGMVINNIVLRTDLSGNLTCRQLLGRVRKSTLEAYANQDVPFERVVKAVQPERELRYNPLFQVGFNFHDAPMPDIDLPDLEVDLVEGISNGSAKFDLNVIVVPHSSQRISSGDRGADNQLTLLWEYSTDLFTEETATRMLDHYQRALWSLIERPEQYLARWDVLSEAERRRIVVEWNQTTSAYPREQCIHELFEREAERRPEAVALVCRGEQVSYEELERRANQMAQHLRSQGVRVEEPVGVLLERSVELLVVFLGILKAGGAYVPMEVSYP
ncbi:MAG TPA: condensation domain-containing protein, partial [Pyrinomonadaceae bacterium]